jgi:hypothetical protein
MKDRRLLSTPGHEPLLDDRGWGHHSGPGQIRVACRCGWTGLTVHERWFTPGENEAQTFAEPYCGIVAQYGADVMLSGNNDAYGTREDAIRLYLSHIGYDPDADRKRVLTALTEAADMLKVTIAAPKMTLDATLRDAASTGSLVTDALADLNAAVARVTLWETTPVLVAVQPDPEGRRLIAEHEAERRAAQAKADAEPLSDEVREMLGLSPEN